MVKSVFDIYIEEYDDWFNRNQHAYLTELLALKKELSNGKKAIEIGIGTAALLLAREIDQKIQFLDCDVEKPNAGILSKSKITEITFISIAIPITVSKSIGNNR